MTNANTEATTADEVVPSDEDTPFHRYICDTCGFIFDEELGDPVGGVEPGTRWKDIPDDWVCSLCGDPKSEFSLLGNSPSKSANRILDTGESKAIVVIGSGYAGWRLTKAIRSLSVSADITMLTKSTGDDYNRTQLSKKIGSRTLNIATEEGEYQAEMYGLDLVPDCEVIGIDKRKKIVITNNGIFNYDKLIIAAGSTTIQTHDENINNVYTIDQIEQYERLTNELVKGDRIAVIGGGLIGCEVADSLQAHHFDVSIINRGSHLLGNLIPEPVARRLEVKFEKSGISVYNNVQVDKLAKSEHRVKCSLSDGTVRKFDKVISCTGTSAVTDFAARAGFKAGSQGIIVDEFMRVDGADIFALGDCVEFNGQSYRYLSSINAQAEVIANELVHGDQKQNFSDDPIVVKIRTPSFPITIRQHQVGQKADTWKALEDDAQGIRVELFKGDTSVGVVEAGYAD